MKSKYLLIASIATLFAVGYSIQESVKQSLASPISEESLIAANPNSVKTGSFVSGEHSTSGTVRIITKNGKSSLELDQSFKTSNMGPDLVVILHRSNNVIASTKPPSYPLKEGDYVLIAPLKKFSGSQSYSIPNNVNLADYKSAVIWCRKFNATFGAATLK
ncbi:DM13 domain-containing protein [Floridanema evergladense]|uniref:DM13 domain-containing protein n=1 Tax=Floridaenema evergladense BLCC-F167 TaxID=3153639 RepID=A0ABV4WIL5_9CYAN